MNRLLQKGIRKTRFCFLCTLIAIFVSVWLFAAKPHIVFDTKKFDFGEIIAGETAVCLFNFMNAGDSLLKIYDIRSTCACAVSALEKRSFEPGEKGTIKVVFHSTGIKKGNIAKSIFISTNDKENRVNRLSIVGFVKKTWKCEPEKVDFGEIGERRILVDTVTITTESVDSIQIDSITTETDSLAEKLHVEIISHKGDTVRLKVRVATSKITWRFIGIIRFYSNIPEAWKIIIPVYARVNEEDVGKN